MIVTCVISIAIMTGGIPWINEVAVDGRVKNSNQTHYLVDFTNGLKKYNTPENSDYSNILVEKTQCVKK